MRDPTTKKVKGRLREMGLGACITVSLAEARQLALECRKLRENGIDRSMRGRLGQPLSNMAMLKLLEHMGRDDLTVHGFRSTFRDWASEWTNFPGEVVETALAHTIESKTEAAYRRGDLFEKRRRLMDAWAAFCSAAAVPCAVVPLKAS